MSFGGLRNLAIALALGAASASAATEDESLLGAYDAYRAGDAIRFARHAGDLEGHLLAPWLDYWRLAMRLEDAASADVSEFLSRYRDTYVAELLRGDWLRLTGRRGEWQAFDREVRAWPREDLEIRCYGWLSRLARQDDSAFAEARAMWLVPGELPEGCARLADTRVSRDRLDVTDIWKRVRVLFEHGQITAAKTTLGYLPRKEAPDERLLAEAARQPGRFFARLPKNLERRPAPPPERHHAPLPIDPRPYLRPQVPRGVRLARELRQPLRQRPLHLHRRPALRADRQVGLRPLQAGPRGQVQHFVVGQMSVHGSSTSLSVRRARWICDCTVPT